eukprot:scaffold4967_cov116-Isochrysis_galbana.AAC.9
MTETEARLRLRQLLETRDTREARDDYVGEWPLAMAGHQCNQRISGHHHPRPVRVNDDTLLHRYRMETARRKQITSNFGRSAIVRI